MTHQLDYQYLLDCKRALERLNPKMLASVGEDEDTNTVCVIYAVSAHRSSKEKIPRERLISVSKRRDPYTGPTASALWLLNDSFLLCDNSEAAQKARYKHVYKWVCQQIKKSEKC